MSMIVVVVAVTVAVVVTRLCARLSASLLSSNVFAGETTLCTAGACWLVLRAFQLGGCAWMTAITQSRPVRRSRMPGSRASRSL